MPGQRAQQVIRAHRVDAQDVGRLRERLALMGRAGEVIDVIRRIGGDRRVHGVGVEQVDAAPRDVGGDGRRRMSAGAVPGHDARRGLVRVRRQQPIEQVPRGEAGAAGDEHAGAGPGTPVVRAWALGVLRLVVGA